MNGLGVHQMQLFHATTPKKARRYRETGMIIIIARKTNQKKKKRGNESR